MVMCLMQKQMVILLIPPTAQMDCQSSHWKSFQECAYPKSSRENLGALLSTKLTLSYTAQTPAIHTAQQKRYSNKDAKDTFFFLIEIKCFAYTGPFTQGSWKATTSLPCRWTNFCPEEVKGLSQSPWQPPAVNVALSQSQLHQEPAGS